MRQGVSKGRRLLRALTILNVLFVLGVYFAETCVAERHWLATLVTYAPQQLVPIPALILLAWSALVRQRKLGAVNTAAVAFVAVTLLGFNIPFGRAGTGSGPRVRIMTYNINHGSRGAESIARNIRLVRPDIVCLQEAIPYAKDPDPIVGLRRLLPGWQCVQNGQLVVFSRYPIEGCEVHSAPVDYWRAILQARIVSGGQRLTVVNLHMNTAARAESLVRHRGSVRDYLRGGAAVRSLQVSRLLDVVGRIDGPVVVTGDFNTPPRGRLYRRLCGKLTDSFAASGWGCGYSFRANLPVMRIDYIFAGNGLHPVRCRSPRLLPASDHRPVVADLAFGK